MQILKKTMTSTSIYEPNRKLNKTKSNRIVFSRYIVEQKGSSEKKNTFVPNEETIQPSKPSQKKWKPKQKNNRSKRTKNNNKNHVMQKMATDAETCKAKFVSVLHELHSDEGGGDGKTLIPKLNQAIHSFILYTSWLFSAVGLTKYTTLL